MASKVSNINRIMNTTRLVVGGKRAQEEFVRLCNEWKSRPMFDQIDGKPNNIRDDVRRNRYNDRVVFFCTTETMSASLVKEGTTSDPMFSVESLDLILNVIKGDNYRLIRFYTTTGILILRDCRQGNVSNVFFEKEYRCNFGQPCILGIDDFTEEFKTSQLPIEKQLEIMVEMNKNKHMETCGFNSRISRLENNIPSILSRLRRQMESQECQLNKMQRIISDIQSDREMMQKQIQQMKWKLDITYFYVVLLFIGVLYIL
jgi:hypothetical protein